MAVTQGEGADLRGAPEAVAGVTSGTGTDFGTASGVAPPPARAPVARQEALARYLTPDNLRLARGRIFDAHPAAAGFDQAEAVATERVLVLLSTPRSGSNMLCDLLWRNRLCLAHEYCQHYWILPLMADRFGAIRGGRLDGAAYVQALARARTLPGGTLGINLHGEHLWVFEALLEHFGGLEMRYVHLSRQDRLAQAVSLGLAHATGRWSSEYGAGKRARYSFSRTRDAFQSIALQEEMIDAFLARHGLAAERLSYEEAVADPAAAVRRVVGREVAIDTAEAGLRRQGGDLNREARARFRSDLLRPPPPPPGRLRRRWQALLRRLS